MEIKFLGTGGAFDVEFGNSAALVFSKKAITLIDCGFMVLPQLVKHNMAHRVDQLLITHLHDDHVGSLSGFILYRKHRLKLKPLPIYCPSQAFADQIKSFLAFSLGNADNYLDFRLIEEQQLIGAIDTFGLHIQGMQTWAYYFKEAQASLVYSGDLGDGEVLFDNIEKLGFKDPLIFHELTFSKDNDAHVYYQDLQPRLEKYRIYGYHCNPNNRPEDCRIPLVIHQKQFMCASET